MGSGASPEIFQNISQISKFTLNHHRNIVIILISQKFGGGPYRLRGGAGPQAPMVATALNNAGAHWICLLLTVDMCFQKLSRQKLAIIEIFVHHSTIVDLCLTCAAGVGSYEKQLDSEMILLLSPFAAFADERGSLSDAPRPCLVLHAHSNLQPHSALSSRVCGRSRLYAQDGLLIGRVAHSAQYIDAHCTECTPYSDSGRSA